jgi:hypothetical protein
MAEEEAPKVSGAILEEIGKERSLKPVGTAAADANPALEAARLQLELKKGADLKPVDKPKEGISDAIREAYLEDKKGGDAPASS